ncbi:chemotaxis protein CheA [candidate division KSB1 bacterium]|nr:chemotaxis protein CheA [candidate division KSB1 bacterium]
MERHQAVFREEAYELLAELEKVLLELETTPDDVELVARIFRAMHTLKGSGAMFGFDAIATFTHELENIYDNVREGRLQVTKELIDLSFAACDEINVMLESNEQTVHHEQIGKITAGLHSLLRTNEPVQTDTNIQSEKTQQQNNTASVSNDMSSSPTTYFIRFQPQPELFQNGTNPLLLLNELADMGECHIFAHMDKIPNLEKINPEECYIYWDILLTTTQSANDIQDVFIFVEDSCKLKIEVVDRTDLDEEVDYKKLGEILVDHGDISVEAIQDTLKNRQPIGEMLVSAGLVNEHKVQSALLEQKHVREVREKRLREKDASSIRVASDKLDTLVNLVGELVIVQARLNQSVVGNHNPDLIQISEEVERLSSELREVTMSIRMLPIGTTFSKFKRLVRDLSHDQKKEIALETEGAETELDKTMIEKLSDPLVHIIRNSIDHGIEKPEDRISAGKPRQGTIHLSATHSGADMVIQIRDDGRGLNTKAIQKKAVEKGIISGETELSEKETFQLIFAPGFSTAETVTSVSGRGVGMDVVKRNIESLRGSIDVASTAGKGTIISLKLPLTLGIIEGLLVKLAEDYFVLPLQSIEECVELTREDVARTHGQNICQVRGEIVPYIRLREQFHLAGESPEIEQVVILHHNDYKIGFVVDSIIGQYQTVIKSMGKMYKDIEGISGATILGDGTVALILDIHKLVQQVELVAA